MAAPEMAQRVKISLLPLHTTQVLGQKNAKVGAPMRIFRTIPDFRHGKRKKHSAPAIPRFPSRAIAVLCVLLLCIPCVIPARGMAGGALVFINKTTFPDDNFRKAVLADYSDGKGRVNPNVTEIDVSGMVIWDLTGIEHFKSLTTLDCYDNILTSLDFTGNPALQYLDCENAALTTLKVSGNPALQYLNCDGNQLEAVMVYKNPALIYLSCSDNNLYTLNVSRNPALLQLECFGNQLSSLDISKSTKLTALGCGENHLDTLDVSHNPALKALYCYRNELSALDVSNNTELQALSCFDNLLPSLDVSKNPKLTALGCGKNMLFTLDVTNNPALVALYCDTAQLTSLDVTKNPALKILDCGGNQLVSLDLSKNTKLEELDCNGNELQTLDVSRNKALALLQCENNQLPSLNLSNNSKLLLAALSGQRCSPFACVKSGGSFRVNLKELPNGHLIDTARVTMTDGSKLNASTGIVTYSAAPSAVTYTYDTRSPGGGETLMAVAAQQAPLIRINANTFPDPRLRAAMLDYYHGDDGYIDTDVMHLSLFNQDIRDLSGIEYFPKLFDLSCNHNPLQTLDMSTLPKLEALNCSECQLTLLNVADNALLQTLTCYDNQLMSLDISQNTSLWALGCWMNQLSSLDTSHNVALKSLSCEFNRLIALDLSKNTALERLNCSDNELTVLDISRNTALEQLQCENNHLTSLDLSGHPQIYLAYFSNQTAGPLIYTQSGGRYQVDLTALPHSDRIDFSRVTLTDGGTLDPSTGIVTYASLPAAVTYTYDTRKTGYGETGMPVAVSVIAFNAGDANGDESVDIMDLVTIIDYIVNDHAPASSSGADANGDGTVDIMDLVFIIDLIVNPPTANGMQVDSTKENTVSVEIPFSASSPITALEVDYTLSPGLTFAGADCTGMTGTGGNTKAMFTSISGVTSGTVTLDVVLNSSATADQTVTVTEVTGANTAGTIAVGTPLIYTIPVNASALAILTQPADTTVLSGTKASFTVEAAGAEPLAYQWYVNTNTGVGWLALSGATEAIYTTDTVTLSNNRFRYYCRITDANGTSLDSTTATLSVAALPQTGDSSHPVWMIVLLLAGIGITFIQQRKRNAAEKQR